MYKIVVNAKYPEGFILDKNTKELFIANAK